MNWYKKAKQEYPRKIDWRNMADFIRTQKPKNAYGRLDDNEVKDMAAAATQWTLETIPLDKFDWVADPDIVNNKPIIVVDHGGGEYEVLDGKHRIGAAKARGETSIRGYVGRYS